MADYGSFTYGAVKFPIPTDGTGPGGPGASFLRDGDPTIYYLLEFCKKMIEVYVGPRLISEAAIVGFDVLHGPVGETLPLNPEPFLLENQIRFPLLAAYRQSSKFEWIGRSKNIVDDMVLVYVLPPMTAGEAERLMPTLHAVALAIDNRVEQGFDPNYTPSAPTGTTGEPFWTRANLTSVGLKTVQYGSFMSDENIFFPAVTMTLEVKARSGFSLEEFEELTGINVHEDLVAPDQPTYPDLVEFEVDVPMKLTLVSPNTGTKAGGTTVTLTGQNFRAGLQPKVFFDDVPATDVVVINATTIQCKSPAFDAYPTAMVDIHIVQDDGQSDVSPAAYTYTTP